MEDMMKVYNSICKPQLEKLTEDVGTIKAKIFNGHSKSIENIESDIKDVKKLLVGMVVGSFSVLVSIVIYVLFGVSI